MAMEAKMGSGRRINQWRLTAWGLAAALLLLPLVAMQLTEEVNWTASDFVFAGVLIASVGIGLELAVRTSSNRAYRAGVAFALAAAFVILWSNGAVGMIGDEENRYNLLFVGVIGVAFVAAIIGRFQARGMSRAMIAATVAHLGTALGGLETDASGAFLSAALGTLWLVSATLFGIAARK